jgi:hypothetical protein
MIVIFSIVALIYFMAAIFLAYKESEHLNAYWNKKGKT